MPTFRCKRCGFSCNNINEMYRHTIETHDVEHSRNYKEMIEDATSDEGTDVPPPRGVLSTPS